MMMMMFPKLIEFWAMDAGYTGSWTKRLWINLLIRWIIT